MLVRAVAQESFEICAIDRKMGHSRLFGGQQLFEGVEEAY